MLNQNSERENERYCADDSPEDGQDPREFHDKRRLVPKPKNRKALQLCAQIREALTWILSTECEDDVLSSLDVIDVRPWPTSARVLVILCPAMSSEVHDVDAIMSHLANANGMLRSAMARAIHRKKTPELTFSVVPK